MEVQEILHRLESLRDPTAIEGMARYGITPDSTYGIKIPRLREIAKEAGRRHELSLSLWDIKTRETMILASMTADPVKFTEELMDSWTLEFDYWEICDQCCMNIFEKMPIAYRKAEEYAYRDEEYVKRTGFVLMARLAVSDKPAVDDRFKPFFPIMLDGCTDERNMVKKGVNWALRQIGKRNASLHAEAISVGEEMLEIDSKSARWIATDALRELRSESVQRRLGIL